MDIPVVVLDPLDRVVNLFVFLRQFLEVLFAQAVQLRVLLLLLYLGLSCCWCVVELLFGQFMQQPLRGFFEAKRLQFGHKRTHALLVVQFVLLDRVLLKLADVL